MKVRKRTWTDPQGETKEAWVADYTDQTGKRRMPQFARKKDAQAKLDSVAAEMRAGVHVADSASITIAKAAENWLTAGREAGLEASTLDQREQHVRLHIDPFIGKLKLSQLSVPRVRSFESELRAAGRSAVMVGKVITSLSGILSDALERGTVARNVVRELRGKRKAPNDRHKRRYEAGVDIPLPTEVKAIIGALDALDGHYRPLILTALFTGLRASELRGLDWRNVDLDAGVLHVRERADKNNVIGAPKTVSSQRTVPLTPRVVNALRPLRLKAGGKGLVFGTRSGRPDNVQNVVKRGWWPPQIAAGLSRTKLDEDGRPVLDTKGQPVVIGKYSGLHATRHFYASWCINAPEAGGLGLSPKAVQERLGHANISMTLDVYGHLFPRSDDSAKLAAAEAALLA